MNTPVEVMQATAAETAASGVAHRRLHLPTSVAFTGDDERPAYRAWLESLLLRAVAQAVEKDDRSAGINGPRPAWPSAGDGTAAGAPVAPTAGGRAHLTFAMAVTEGDEGEEGAGGGEEEGKEGNGGAAQRAGGAVPGESGGDATKETAPSGAPPAETRRTSGTAATAGVATAGTATPATATATAAEPAASPPEATVPDTVATPWLSPEEEAAAAPGGTEEVSSAAEAAARKASGRITSATVVSDPRSEVVEGPSPVDGRAVMVIGATQLVMLGEATRYARSRSLLHAVQLGDHLFGARSFAVLEGSTGTSESYYLAVATAPTVTDETLGQEVAAYQLAGQRISTFTGFRVLPVVTTLDGHRYEVNLLWTKERGWIWGSAEEGKRWIQLSRSAQEFWLSAEELKALTFQGLDRLVEAGLAGDEESLEQATARLGEMNVKAFALVDERTKEKYLEILVKSWTFEEQRHAIIQIMISLDGLAQLQAVRDRLIHAGLYEQLFADMGSDVWDLLTAVGKRFGDHQDLTVRELIGFVTEALNITMKHDAELSRSVEQEQTAVLGLKLMIEIEEAVRAVMGFVLGTLESLKVMLTQPEKILSGLWELQKLTVMCYAAYFGDPVSTRQLKALVEKVGPVLVDGLRGAAIFGIGDRLLKRIKWAVIIEALTWISEIQAVVEALAKIEKIAAILRFLKMLKAFEGERIAGRFTRLAEALHAGSAVLKGLKDEHAVVDLLVMLPEEEGVRLGAALREVDVPQGAHLAELMEHPRLGPVLAELRPKAEVLGVLGVKSGGLTPELARTFARLTGKDGFTTAEVAKVVEALQGGEGTRFARMLEEIGFGRIGAQAQVKADLLAMLAGDSRRMEAVHQYGIAVVGQMHARSAGSAEAFDAMVAKLEKLRAQHMADGRAVEFSELVDKLRQGKKGSWRRVDRPPTAPRVKATAAERAPVLQRIKELRKRFPQKKVKNAKAMNNALRQIAQVSETDPAKAMEHLEKFEDLLRAEGTTQGHVAEIVAEAEAKATREAKALHHEPDEAPSQALSARDELKSKTGVAGSPSHELKEAKERMAQLQAPGNPAHHAVPAGDIRGEVPRAILEEMGINPADSPLNGVYLPRTSMDPNIVPQAWTRHEVLHTDNYYKWITQTVVEARQQGGADGVMRALFEIKEKLLNGTHLPRDVSVPHESYADWFAGYRHNLDWMTDEEQLELLERLRAARQRKRAPKVSRKVAPRETAAEAGPQPRPPGKAESKPKPESKANPEAKAKAKSQPTAKSQSKAEVKPKAEAKSGPEAAVQPEHEVKPKPATAMPEPEPQPEPDVRRRIVLKDEPPVPAAAGPRISLEPEPEPRKRRKRYRVDETPPTRVSTEVDEDVRGEPLYLVDEDAPKPERKQKRADFQGRKGR